MSTLEGLKDDDISNLRPRRKREKRILPLVKKRRYKKEPTNLQYLLRLLITSQTLKSPKIKQTILQLPFSILSPVIKTYHNNHNEFQSEIHHSFKIRKEASALRWTIKCR
jgi:hypothetical protein